MIPVSSRVGPIILAHRGGNEVAPENSLEAFADARQLGIRHIETDVHLTADGKVVVHHDPMIDRVYNGSGLIAQMTWDELKTYTNDHGDRIPLLSEALETFPDLYFNIDAKVPGVEGPLLDVVRQAHAENRVVLASFNERRLKWLREQSQGQIATSLGSQSVVRLVAAAKSATKTRTWRIPGSHQGVVAAQVPLSFGPVTVVDRRFVAAAHSHGLAVHVWTVDEIDDLNQLIALGVDGFVTNKPKYLRDYLIDRGLWEELPAPDAMRGQHPRD